MKTKRTAENLSRFIDSFLKKHSLLTENPSWLIKESSLGGVGVFAKRFIQPGEIIFKDFPIILGPRNAVTSPAVCVSCFSKQNLKPCENLCGLPICSPNCQNSDPHRKECKVIRQWKPEESLREEFSLKLLKALAPVRSLLLSEQDKDLVKILKAHKGNQHGREVDVLLNDLNLGIKEDDEDFMRFVCSVLDANAFEVIVGNENNQSSLRGLYPLGSLANHCCTPNTFHVFDENQHMITRASVQIQEGEEIFHSYSRLIWGTTTRRYHLHLTKHFLCKCPRCCDPTEFGTYMSAILCKKCRGRVKSLNCLQNGSDWQCEDCNEIYSRRDVGLVTSMLGATLMSFDDEDVSFMLRFLNNKLATLVPENNQVVVELKYKIIWILGYKEGMTWQELSEELMQVKETFCRELLDLLEHLRTGLCKIRGLLLFELYLCLKERNRRENGKQKYELEMNRLLNESADILMYDVSTPEELKSYNISRRLS